MQHHPLFVIDVQPAHRSVIGPSMMDRLLKEVRNRLAANAPVTFFFNESSVSQDTLPDVQEFLLDYGLTQDEMECCGIQEKADKFLRHWMDLGVSDPDIVMAQRALRRSKKPMSVDALKKACYSGVEIREPLFLPAELEDMNIAEGSRISLAGGDRDGGLREFELWLSGKNCHSDRLDHLTF